MKKIGIYSIKNKVTNFIYIGLSTNIEQRFSFHKKRLFTGKHKNKHLQSSFNANGSDNFIFEIIELCDERLLGEKEKFWVKYYKSYDRLFGYNKTYGGEFGRVSKEANKSRIAKLKLQTISQEMRNRISKTITGRKYPIRNKFTPDVEQQIIKDFNGRIGIRVLACKYTASTCAIYNIFKRGNIEWRKNKV